MPSGKFPPPPPAPEVPPLEKVRHVHLAAVAGTGMGALAGMLRSRGFRVSGSDQNVYPPMSTQLAEAGIELKLGYRPENLEPAPDLVIVGNALSRGNPEIEALLERGIPYLSFPAALARFFLAGKHSVVVAGTHGKTTTASLAAWVLASAGVDPSFMIGGVPGNFGTGNRLGSGPHFVVEGDEYDTAFFDKESKFLHYQPRTAILTSVEFDHADIFRDLDHVKSAFRKFAALIPEDGLLVVHGEDAEAVDCASAARARTETYGVSGKADWTVGDLRWNDGRASFDVVRKGSRFASVELPMLGTHNLQNALGVIAALAGGVGLPPEAIARGLAGFKGIKRRQEVRGEQGGVTVIDDFAHHPTAVRVTLQALKAGYPGRRLWAILEPRSATSRRNVFQKAYADAFGAADKVVIAGVFRAEKLEDRERLEPAVLVEDLRAKGQDARCVADADRIVEHVVPLARKGDVIAVLSNGGFDGLHEKLLASLAEA